MKIFFFLFGILLSISCLNPAESFAQWIQTKSGSIHCFTTINNMLYTGTTEGVFLSTDNGITWTPVNNGLTHIGVRALAATSDSIGGSILLSGTSLYTDEYPYEYLGGGVFLSTNSGSNWNISGLEDQDIWSLTVSKSYFFAGTWGSGIFRSSDSGASWNTVHPGIVYSFVISGSNIFAAADSGIFRSTDNGNHWTPVDSGLPIREFYGVLSFAVSGSNLFAGTVGRGVFMSSNNGDSWTPANSGMTNKDVYALATNDSILIAGTPSEGVFLSINNGISWSEISAGMTNNNVRALLIHAGYVFVGTFGGGLWRRPLTDLITSCQQTPNQLPKKLVLHQNYPNPFNPTTDISFSLPSRSFVTLKIYDALGRDVATLYSKELSAGEHSQQWNPTGLPSGIYFYRLHVGSFTETKKLILLR